MADKAKLTPTTAARIARKYGLTLSDALALRGLLGEDGDVEQAEEIARRFAEAAGDDDEVSRSDAKEIADSIEEL